MVVEVGEEDVVGEVVTLGVVWDEEVLGERVGDGVAVGEVVVVGEETSDGTYEGR